MAGINTQYIPFSFPPFNIPALADFFFKCWIKFIKIRKKKNGVKMLQAFSLQDFSFAASIGLANASLNLLHFF